MSCVPNFNFPNARWCAFKAKPAFKRWLGPVQEAWDIRRERLIQAVGRRHCQQCISAAPIWEGLLARVRNACFVLAAEPDAIPHGLVLGTSAWQQRKHKLCQLRAPMQMLRSEAPTIHALFDTCSDEPGETVRSRPAGSDTVRGECGGTAVESRPIDPLPRGCKPSLDFAQRTGTAMPGPQEKAPMGNSYHM